MKTPLAALLILTAGALPAFANQTDIARVDIYRYFDVNNPVTGWPYDGWVGSYTLPESNPGELNITFNDPLGLSQFVAVITTTEYVSISGYYITAVSAFPTQDGVSGYDPFWSYFNDGSGNAEPWMIGGWANEIWLNAGDNVLQTAYFGIPYGYLDSFGEPIGGAPYDFQFDFPIPWGGDENVWNATYYMVPVPDSMATIWSMLFAVCGLLAWKVCWQRSRSPL